MRQKIIINLIFSVFFSLPLLGQSDEALKEMKRGDLLRETYCFEESFEAYQAAMAILEESLNTNDDSLLKLQISDKLLMAENGRNMMDFVYKPEVITKHRFSLDDFFLYYPLPDSSWYSVPCQLDSLGGEFAKAVYMPAGSDTIYWSAPDQEGIRNIYKSEYQDSVWTVPALLNEQVTSVADEVYPILSADGKKLYFSSAGLYGVGGQDIYVCEWDEALCDWSVPVNMGFPYSSPADDFLFVDSKDKRYTIFASNRDCPSDSVWVYVLKHDNMPVRKSVTDSEELRELAALNPSDERDEEAEVEADIPENVDTRRYMGKMSEVRMMRDSIFAIEMKVENLRVQYAQASSADEKAEIEQDILDYELFMPVLQDSLEKASRLLQEIEMEFLFSGVVIDPEKLLAEADREIVGQTADYEFVKNHFGKGLSLNILEPEPTFDYSFKILDEGQFAEDNTLPKGLVYQIQIFSAYSKANVKQIKGLSPVFETVSSKGRYTYKVGLFNTYADVLSHLNAVKKVGFRNAFISASLDGKDITVAKARALEAELLEKSSFYEVRIVTGASELDSSIADGVRQQAAGKDIARSVNSDGANVYIIGPFADKEAAERLASFVRAMGVPGAECHKINRK